MHMQLRTTLAYAAVIATTSAGCTVEYGRTRLPFAAPVLVPVSVACQPITASESRLSVTVVDEIGQPIPGAAVLLVALPRHQKLGSGFSNTHGQVTFSGLPSETTLELSAKLCGFLPRRSQFKIASPGVCAVTVNLVLSLQLTVTERAQPAAGPA